MSIPEIGVKKPVTTAMIFIGILILGTVSLTRLGLDLLPDIEIPSIMVLTTYKGAGPEEVEERITRVAEEQLATVDNLDKIEGFSQEGMSGITLRFNWGTNLDNAVNDVRDNLDRVKPLIPDEADDPIIFKLDVNMMPILVYGVSAEETYPRLKKLLEDNVCLPLESVTGVASAVVRGGLERAILVELDAERLKAYNISINQVENAIVSANLSTPGGHIKEGRLDYIVRVPEEIKVKQIEDVAIGVYNGVPVKIKDIATVRDSFKEITQETLVDRRHGLVLMIQKESDANTVNTCRAVFKKLETLKETLPSDVKFTLVSDSSDQIVKSINNLRNSLISGGILVILVIFLFLGNIRSSLIIASAIPISLIITFVFLYMAGYTINIVSLSALAIAIGMVVDASIVVHENIHRHLENGEELKGACIVGGNEVAGA
ncbi:MAG: efflux RND transporter permease subunit, partial [Candidatus Ratteibacteria bacterium]|nr:efflux RND transporter permease subunit [Candidatus Ratteibacteria bacterium]